MWTLVVARNKTCKLTTAGIVTGGVATGGAVSGVAALAVAGVAGTVLLIPVGIGLLVGTVGAIAYYSVHSRGRGRGLEYQNVKFLYDSFHKDKLLSKLQTHSIKLQQLSDNVDTQIETYKLEYGTHQQAITNKNDDKKQSKATKLYYKTKEAEIEQLRSSEPDMDGAMRKRMATKIAVSSCKTYLKESMGYSNFEADEFIEDLQS